MRKVSVDTYKTHFKKREKKDTQVRYSYTGTHKSNKPIVRGCAPQLLYAASRNDGLPGSKLGNPYPDQKYRYQPLATSLGSSCSRSDALAPILSLTIHLRLVAR